MPFKESFFGSYGPVGDLPLHLIFLMGMDVFCRDCILTVYAVPGLRSRTLPCAVRVSSGRYHMRAQVVSSGSCLLLSWFGGVSNA